MIISVKHRGLKRFFERGDSRGLPSAHIRKIRYVLTVLDTVSSPHMINIPGGRLHRLKGDRKEYWSLAVSRNWRITFRFDEGDVYDLDYEDYH